MTRTTRTKNGVLCLESDWWGIRDPTSVEPALQLLKSYSLVDLPYIHRNVGTVDEFEYYLRKWSQRGMDRYPILYLALHGDDSVIFIGDMRKKSATISLDQVGKLLEGKCSGRIIHFGSCGTLAAHGNTLDKFMRRTGVTALLGYRQNVDWIQSSAFEILMLSELQGRKLTRPSLRVAKKRIHAIAGGLSKALDFRMRISKPPRRRAG